MILKRACKMIPGLPLCKNIKKTLWNLGSLIYFLTTSSYLLVSTSCHQEPIGLTHLWMFKTFHFFALSSFYGIWIADFDRPINAMHHLACTSILSEIVSPELFSLVFCKPCALQVPDSQTRSFSLCCDFKR